ncbi:hypothetical protein PO909_020592 [Leuciscus waleckii]
MDIHNQQSSNQEADKKHITDFMKTNIRFKRDTDPVSVWRCGPGGSHDAAGWSRTKWRGTAVSS